ncbi:MAG: ATP-binding protein [Myxococcales bacterium]|jgi:nitrogen-specific signal transduction histidine kinase/ActR/RegA family two-component response regulator
MKSTSDTGYFSRRTEALHPLIDASSGAADLQRSETERMASLGTLAAGVAHEINNPLSYVLGSLDLGLKELYGLRERLHGEELEHVSGAVAALDSAREGAERVRNIVRDLMDFSRAGASAGDSVDVEAILDATIRIAWNEIRHRARLVKRYGGIARVSGDEARLGQVFLNLIMNAAQAIDGDPSLNEIAICTRSEAGAAVIEISDTGGGIREHDLGRIFDPFYTTKATGTGVGLGLAICRGIVTSFGGEISVSSQPGRGTSFTVVLPYAPEDSAARRAVVEAPPESESAPARILIIDDEPLLGQTLLYAFKGRHDVSICTSGRAGLSRLEQDAQFDLVLCDLMMPDVSGAAVFEAVKRDHPELVARFVFMTGGAFTDRAREFLAQHAGAQLEKPFNIADIEKILRQFAAARAVAP